MDQEKLAADSLAVSCRSLSVCMYVCVCVRVCVCVCIYTYIHMIYILVTCVVLNIIYINKRHVVFNIITLCRSASLQCCARLLVPPFWSTCVRSANLYWCARIETTIVSSSYVSQQFCIGVPLLRLQSYHHQYTSPLSIRA